MWPEKYIEKIVCILFDDDENLLLKMIDIIFKMDYIDLFIY